MSPSPTSQTAANPSIAANKPRKLIAIAAVLAALVIAAIVGYILTQSGDRPLVAKGRKEIVTIAAGGEKSDQRPAIAAGRSHTLALDTEGKVYATGANSKGQLGLGDKDNRDGFTPISSLESKKIVAIAAGRFYSLALDADGKVYGTGENDVGQLGLGDKDNRDSFTLVSSLEGQKIVAIAAGRFYSLALDADGKVYGTGENDVGQLGLGDKDNRDGFTLVSSLEGKKIVAIAAGESHSLVLSKEGKVYAAGYNYFGQLGFRNNANRKTWTLVSSLSDKNITAIEAQFWYSLALDTDGKVYAAGANYRGQLGLGDKTDRDRFALVKTLEGKKIVAIAAGDFHSLALNENGKLYATGWNREGQLGLVGDNRNAFELVSSQKNKKIVAIAAGEYHSFAIDENGKLYAAGSNFSGQLGLGDKADRNVFTPVILSDRQLK
ncbi:MAG: hypothetical protein LBO72_04195 [Helicobacteraceae bacterium]|jgi:alpha-tubulin suppressor-like RCC1 family protein|nr:hypothetical protein [Helicobacteraceae bacterium]